MFLRLLGRQAKAEKLMIPRRQRLVKKNPREGESIGTDENTDFHFDTQKSESLNTPVIPDKSGQLWFLQPVLEWQRQL